MNEHVDDLLALYALGGLEADEARRVDAHLTQCAPCRALAKQEQQLVLAVAAATPPRAPDSRLKARLLAQVGAVQSKPARHTDRQPNWLALPRWVLAGLSLALALLAGWNVYLTREIQTLQRQVRGSTSAVALISSPDTAAITLEGRGAMPSASGQAYVDFDSQDVVLIVRRLEPLPADKIYQAWVVTDDGPKSAGLMDVNANGWGMTWLDVPFVSGGWVCVSVEPSGGSLEPTEVVLWGGE
jgi:anti-sigma-K factor RskA